jgi:flagellar motility protein MotE (MotC chaperone)
MKKIVKLSLIVSGVALGFGAAFAGFARLQGAAWHEIPLAGKLFPAPPAPEEGEVATLEAPKATPGEARAALAVFDLFRVESPFSTREIQGLVDELKRRARELDQRDAALDERERRAGERSAFLDEQYAALARLRSGLESWEGELAQRAAEVEHKEKVRADEEGQSWVRLAKIFEEGEPEELGRRLESYSPEEAARILHNLKPVRAKQLLDSISGARWKEYAEAYRVMER